MNKQAAIEHFGSVRLLAAALGISVQAINQWERTVPETSAYKLHVLTAGRLAVNPATYAKAVRRESRARA